MAGKATKAKGPAKSISGLAKYAKAKKRGKKYETTSEDAMLGSARWEADEKARKAKEAAAHEEKKAAGGYAKTAGELAFEARMRGETPKEEAAPAPSEKPKKTEHREIRDQHEKMADEAMARGDKAAAEEHQHAAHLHDVAARHHAYGWEGKEEASKKAHEQSKIVNEGGSSKSPPKDPDEQADYHRGELDKLKAKMQHGGDKSPETKAAYDKHLSALDKLREGGATKQKEDRGTETGPRGGKYYISASGEKVYVK